MSFIYTLIKIKKNKNLIDGGAKRDRTADLLRAKQALSQLSYNPKKIGTSGGS